MNTSAHLQQGFSVTWLVIAIALAVTGYYVADWVLATTGEDNFRKGIRFIAFMFGLFLGPTWLLYSELRTLKDHDAISDREKREVDHRVSLGIRKVIRTVIIFVGGAILVATAGMWPQTPEATLLLAKISLVVFGFSFGLLVSILLNLMEVSRFDTILTRKKQERDNKKNLLEELHKDTKSI